MITVKYNGRLGNQIFQYMAASIFAEKHNLFLDFRTQEENGYKNLSYLLKYISGEKKIDCGRLEINDDNYFNYLNKDEIEDLHYYFNGFFQLRNFVTNYQNDILKRYLYSNVDKRSNDEFIVHLRMADIVSYVGNLDYDYYKNSIQSMNKLKGYIISDEPNSILTNRLIDDFNLELYHKNEYDDFLFATGFNNMILSQGTYSFLIGFFSKAKNVYYSSRPPVWHGDIFLNTWVDMYES